MSVTMSNNKNHPSTAPAPPSFETENRNVSNRSSDIDASQNGQQGHFQPSLAENDMFFDTPTRPQPQSRESLVDSFTLFSTSDSATTGNGASTASSLYNPIVFNQQFSQFQRATNGGKYFPAYQQNGTEISEADPEDEEQDLMQDPAGRVYVQQTENSVDNDDDEKPPVNENDQSLYENYMIDYNADYDQYYDPNVHFHQMGRPDQHYTVEEEEEEEEDIEFYGTNGNVMGDNEVTMDMVADAKTYGLMLPPYHHFKPAPNQQMHPQFQMLQHPYMYGNPFSYNLHTIIEESENESSLQTLSSITSSNFQSLQFDQTNASITPTNAPNRKSSQIGELSDPSMSPNSSQSSESSPSMKERFPRKLGKPHHHHHSHLEHQRSSGENFSEISFTSSSTFSENGSEPDERSDEEYETFQVITANPNLTEHVTTDHIDPDPDPTTSRLERYFTSSLLEANRTKANVPKVDTQPMSLPTTLLNTLPTTLPIIKVTPVDVNQTANELTKPKRQSAQPPKSTFPCIPQKYKLQLLQSTLVALLVDPNYQPLTLEQIHRLNSEFLRFDWIVLLKSIVEGNLKLKFPVLGTKIYGLFRSTLSSSHLRRHLINYLIDHLVITSPVHIIRDHRLASVYIRHSETTENTKQIDAPKSEKEFSKSQIQITINMGQSMIIIKNEPHSNASSLEIPQIPFRARKEVKLRAIQSKRLPTQPDSHETNKMIYRTVLQVNDVNGPYVPLEHTESDDRMQNMRISKLLNQSNPLNRNFLVKSMLNENAESEEKTKQHSEIYGWIQRKPSEPEPLYSTVRDESDRSVKSKGKPNLLNSSTQLLLGSLRNRSKEPNKWNDSETSSRNMNGGKFKTISTSPGNAHLRLTSTRSDAPNHDVITKPKLERSQKASKSFRDQRTSSTMPHQIAGQPNASTTWDSIYGGGMKLLKNISFVRNKNRSSAKDHDSSRRNSVSSDSSDGTPSRNKSLSEPNLHKINRNRARAKAKEESDNNEIYETIKAEPDKTTNSKSTPHLTSSNPSSRERHSQESTDSVTTSAMSTPSLLYRLSNPVTCSRSSMTMRSISTSSLRTRRKNEQSSQYQIGQAAHDGEWQKMAPVQSEEPTNQDLLVWTRKPSSLRMTSSELSSTSIHSSVAQTVTSSHYHRSEIVEQINRTVPDFTVKQPPVQTITSKASASAPTIGELSVAVNYEMRIGSLVISIHKCRIDAIRQKADVYVKVYLLPDRSKSSKRKTRVVKAYRSTTGRSPAGQLQAEFNETLRFTGPFGEFTGRRLWLSIWNNDKFGRNEPIAEMVLGPMDSSLLSSGQLGTITWYRLTEPMSTNPNPTPANDAIQPPPNLLTEHRLLSSSMTQLEPEFAGTIFLAIKFQTDGDPVGSVEYQQSCQQGSLHILIKEAQNLQFNITTPNIIGSTFCKLSLIPERSKQDRDKSSFIKSPLEYSANPRWNQTFVFHNLTAADLQKRTLEISVWFQAEHAMQKSGKKMFVGGVRLSSDTSDSMTNEVNLWNQLLDRHNMWAYGEIPLRQIDDAK